MKIREQVKSEADKYFSDFTGVFKQSFVNKEMMNFDDGKTKGWGLIADCVTHNQKSSHILENYKTFTE